MNQFRVLIADDHPVFRDGIRAIVQPVTAIELVGEAITGLEAVRLAEELQPDIVLMDLKMPELNGIEATRQIVQTSPHIQVLVVTMFEDSQSVFAAMRAGARGYILKDATGAEILRAVQAVGNGEAIFSPAIANQVLTYFSNPPAVVPKQVFPELTERERSILGLIAKAENNAAIARQLNLSLKTVSNYISNIFSKLQVADRAEAIVRAREGGLG
jgi:DNA-binding NarL/FixJ family response regulator